MDEQIRLKTVEEVNAELLEKEMWCEQGCTVPCSWCWSQPERMDFYDEAKGG